MLHNRWFFVSLVIVSIAGLATACAGSPRAMSPAPATEQFLVNPQPVQTILPLSSATPFPSPSPTADFGKLTAISAANAGEIRQLDVIQINSPVYALAVSPDGQWLASGAEDGRVRVYSIAERRPVLHLAGHTKRVLALASSPDSSLLASGSEDTNVFLWQIPSGERERIFSGHNGGVAGLAFSPDGTLLASGSYDESLRIWKATTEGAPRIIPQKRVFFNSLVFSADGRDLYTAANNWKEVLFTIEVWRTVNGRLAHTWRGFKERINSLVLSPDGSLLLTSSGDDINNNGDKNVKIWDVASGKILRVLDGHEGVVYQAVFSPDGSLIASGGDDKTIRLWDAGDGRPLAALAGHAGKISGLAFTADGRLIVSASQDGSLRFWGAAQ
jgi:WD40 repeat protein